MIEWTCPVCQEQIRKSPVSSEEAHSWARCSKCSLRYLWPPPSFEKLRELYSQEYEPHEPFLVENSNIFSRRLRQRHYGLRVQLVNRAVPRGGRLLDVGCGIGEFLHFLCRDVHWRGEGLDINERALTYARTQQVSVHCGRVAEAPFSPASFDIVTLWEVLEHLPDPRAAILGVRRLLVPGGKLLLSTPNPESWLTRWSGRYWHGWQIPYHLYLFSWPNLCHLLTAAGFRVDGRRYLPMERYYVQQTIQTWREGNACPELDFVCRALSKTLLLAGWPILRSIDYASGASAIVLEATAI